MCVCVRACVRACVSVCVCTCVHENYYMRTINRFLTIISITCAVTGSISINSVIISITCAVTGSTDEKIWRQFGFIVLVNLVDLCVFCNVIIL